MMNYEVIVYTGDRDDATTFNDVFINLVGTAGESKRTQLKRPELPSPFSQGKVSSFTVSCPTSLGNLVLIELDKQPSELFPVDYWFPDKVEVKSDKEETYKFPIYCWISDNEVHHFSEGTALRATNVVAKVLSANLYDINHDYYRQQELELRKKDYCWDLYKEGLPHCIKAESPNSLPCEVRFSYTKKNEFDYTLRTGMAELTLKGLDGCTKRWNTYKEIERVFDSKSTDLSDYVMKHWRDDAFFGHQFLNGVNPMMIQRCTALPSNFPVTDDMVFLNGQHNLADEMKNGNLFLCDYKNLDGLQSNIINGKKQYLMAPLVLLHKTPEDELKPIAIQLKQTPAEDNPIFLTTDSEYDWLLAKMFVRSADFTEHELNYHLLRTHLLAEVFSVSLLRNVPRVHPLYKLLVPHTRYTLHINILARLLLISEKGVFTISAACGGEAMITILKRSLSSLTYSSLCIPDNITERGLESVPHFYYRDDGLRLWKIIHSFVQGILEYYYKKDADVQQDSELQKWISDIFEHGFLSQESTGIPQEFTTVAELVRFVTMVMFTCSAQHSAVNSGQYDYGGWMPNAPISLQCPPPTKKGTTKEDMILQTLPDVNTTARGMAALWLLSKQSSDFVPLGHYPEEHFSEETPCGLRKVFQEQLQVLSAEIKARNMNLEIPYTYMDPEVVENSVAI